MCYSQTYSRFSEDKKQKKKERHFLDGSADHTKHLTASLSSQMTDHHLREVTDFLIDSTDLENGIGFSPLNKPTDYCGLKWKRVQKCIKEMETLAFIKTASNIMSEEK